MCVCEVSEQSVRNRILCIRNLNSLAFAFATVQFNGIAFDSILPPQELCLCAIVTFQLLKITYKLVDYRLVDFNEKNNNNTRCIQLAFY